MSAAVEAVKAVEQAPTPAAPVERTATYMPARQYLETVSGGLFQIVAHMMGSTGMSRDAIAEQLVSQQVLVLIEDGDARIVVQGSWSKEPAPLLAKAWRHAARDLFKCGTLSTIIKAQNAPTTEVAQ